MAKIPSACETIDLVIEPMTESDIPRAMELKNALGWNQTPEDWRRFLRLSPEGCFKAALGGEMVGTAAACVFDGVCWIGMVIVAGDRRGCGIGRALMRRCLEHGERSGCELTLLDGTGDGAPLYESLGFRAEFPVGTAKARIGSQTGVSAGRRKAPSAVRRVTPGDLGAIVELEARAQGAVRRPLFEILLEQNPGRGFVHASPTGELDGFVLYRPGHHSTQVGPMIVRSTGAARALLGECFSHLAARQSGASVTLTVPLRDGETRGLLDEWGLAAEPRLTRMSRGRRRRSARLDMIYVLSGPEKG